MMRSASTPNRHGSLELNGLFEECSRLIGEKVPSWYQRVASSGSLAPPRCPPMSWLHQKYPTLAAVAVKYGWNARDAQVAIVSPEKPTGYRWLPRPAYREKVRGRLPSRPESL